MASGMWSIRLLSPHSEFSTARKAWRSSVDSHRRVRAPAPGLVLASAWSAAGRPAARPARVSARSSSASAAMGGSQAAKTESFRLDASFISSSVTSAMSTVATTAAKHRARFGVFQVTLRYSSCRSSTLRCARASWTRESSGLRVPSSASMRSVRAPMRGMELTDVLLSVVWVTRSTMRRRMRTAASSSSCCRRRFESCGEQIVIVIGPGGLVENPVTRRGLPPVGGNRLDQT